MSSKKYKNPGDLEVARLAAVAIRQTNDEFLIQRLKDALQSDDVKIRMTSTSVLMQKDDLIKLLDRFRKMSEKAIKMNEKAIEYDNIRRREIDGDDLDDD